MKEASLSELLAEMRGLFGTRRMLELMGLMMLVGAVSSDSDGPFEWRQRLMKLGLSQSAAYRFTGDVKKLGLAVSERRGEMIPMSQVLREINSGDTSLIRENVLK
jgi:hypothetical protein